MRFESDVRGPLHERDFGLALEEPHFVEFESRIDDLSCRQHASSRLASNLLLNRDDSGIDFVIAAEHVVEPIGAAQYLGKLLEQLVRWEGLRPLHSPPWRPRRQGGTRSRSRPPGRGAERRARRRDPRRVLRMATASG